EKQLFHVDVISRDRHYPILPEADIYFGSIMDCNKEYFRVIAQNNPDKKFRFGGYIGQEDFWNVFKECFNVTYHISIEAVCIALDLQYQYGTDYSLFKGTKCIPRLTLSNGCTNHCRFCTIPDEIIEIEPKYIEQQIESMRDLDFELVYINDKTFGQANNYSLLSYYYYFIKEWNPKFRGFTVQTTCYQIAKFWGQDVNLKDLGIVNVEIGIESYNNNILKKYNKPQNIGTIDMALNILKNTGVNIIPNIIIGLPGENLYTYSNTLKWLDDNKQDFLMLNVTNFVSYIGNEASNIVETKAEDFNEAVCKRSYHKEKEAIVVEVVTDLLFDIGMEIIEATKSRTV
ncbi:hypothetical protein LCGC14_2365730, partial [marine sediment metagenome]